MKKLDTDIFIRKARKIHDDKYDYSLVKYKNNYTKVKIICPIHGVFEQIPKNHLKNHGCSACFNVKKLDTDIFIEKAKKTHHNKYDYSLVKYKNNYTKVKIICSIHGQFEQIAENHLSGNGCPMCSKNKKLDTNIFIEKAKKTHQNKYDYSLVEYKNSNSKIKIICPKHGVFEQSPNKHLSGRGCPKCNGGVKLDKNDFIKSCANTHQNKYDYSLVEYKNSNSKIKIICPEHGVFEQRAGNHKNGIGCPMCKKSKGEKIIQTILNNNNIVFIKEKKFENCKDKKQLPFDFYLPEYNLCIEYDGKQHFESIKYWGGNNMLKIIQEHDKIKNQYCKENNINLLRISYKAFNNIKNILEKEIK